MAVVTLTPLKTLIFLAVKAPDAGTATQRAVAIYKTFISRLYERNLGVRELRVDMEEPTAHKEREGIWHATGHLRAVVPDTVSTRAADNYLDAWRQILRTAWSNLTRELEQDVWRPGSYIELTRPVVPGEEEAKEETAAAPKKMIPIVVTLKGQTHQIEVPETDTLLDGVLDKGLPIKFNCKAGVCDECQVKVRKGMEHLPPPNESEHNMLGDKIQQGYRLSCQVSIKGPVEIEQ